VDLCYFVVQRHVSNNLLRGSRSGVYPSPTPRWTTPVTQETTKVDPANPELHGKLQEARQLSRIIFQVDILRPG
jgi:hypothetical protein